MTSSSHALHSQDTSIIDKKDHNKVGFWTLTMLVVGNLVGSGAFMLPVTLAAFGSICLAGWTITSIGAIALSLIFAGLSARSNNNGGPHCYVEEQFGKTAGFYTAWSYWVLSWISNAGLVVGAVGYASPLFGGLDTSTIFISEVILLVVLSIINLLGMHLAGRFEVIFTVCKIIPLVLLPIVGVFYIDSSNFSPLVNEGHQAFSAINATAYLTLWCFIGLETGTVPGSEVKNPRKTIPHAIVSGTILAAIIFILGTIAIMGVVPKDILLTSKAPYADLAGKIFGGSWLTPVALLASFACLGALNGWIMVVSRIAQHAAHDGLFPEFFKKTTTSGAPLWGTIVSTVCTIPFMALSLSENLITQFNFILDFTLSLVLFIYIVCVIAYSIQLMRLKIFTLKRQMLAYTGLIFCLWTLTQSPIHMILYSFIIILLGVPVWWWVSKE